MQQVMRPAAAMALFALVGLAPRLGFAEDAVESPAAVQASARSFLEELAGQRAAAVGGVAHVQVGAPDARLKLAACATLQAALPPGARRSGKTLVVVRCLEGRAWQVFLPAELHVEAPVWASAHALAAGHILDASDLTEKSVDVGAEDGDMRPLTVATGVAIGQTLGRPLPEGVVLHATDLRDLSRVAPGDAVNVVYSGIGFNVSGEGKSIGAASPGQSIQVRMEGGSVVTGVLMDNHVVEIRI